MLISLDRKAFQCCQTGTLESKKLRITVLGHSEGQKHSTNQWVSVSVGFYLVKKNTFYVMYFLFARCTLQKQCPWVTPAFNCTWIYFSLSLSFAPLLPLCFGRVLSYHSSLASAARSLISWPFDHRLVREFGQKTVFSNSILRTEPNGPCQFNREKTQIHTNLLRKKLTQTHTRSY